MFENNPYAELQGEWEAQSRRNALAQALMGGVRHQPQDLSGPEARFAPQQQSAFDPSATPDVWDQKKSNDGFGMFAESALKRLMKPTNVAGRIDFGSPGIGTGVKLNQGFGAGLNLAGKDPWPNL